MSGGDEENGDKPYDPTPRKLQKAREKGEIPKSTDLATAAGYAGFLIAGLAAGAALIGDVGTTLASILDHADTMGGQMLADGGAVLAGGLIGRVGLGLMPLLVVPPLMVVGVLIAQQGVTVVPSKLAPKLSRISLLSNAKNKFGRSGLFEFAKSFVKLAIYCTILALFLRSQLPTLLASLALGPGQVATLLGTLTLDFMAVVLAVALVIGGIDLLWQRAEHHRKNRMSHKEMMDETKESEGDPAMKGKRRQRGYEIAMNRMLADVPTASVVIVNPTHYAVALKWNRAPGTAPTCVAKGVDEVAARIREAAAEAGVPIHSDPPTARALHAELDVGAEIVPEHYAAVAAAIRFAEKMRQRRKAGA